MGRVPDSRQSGGPGGMASGRREKIYNFFNRELDLLESIVSYCKQRRACASNREL
jgi:hypothetical protein